MTKYDIVSLEEFATKSKTANFAQPEQRSLIGRVLSATVLMPLLVAVSGIVLMACFLVWWDIYGFYALKGMYGSVSVFLEWLQYGR